MELLIPTEKISLLLKISHTVPVTVVHPSSLENYCSRLVLVLTVLLVAASTQCNGNSIGQGSAPGEDNWRFYIKKTTVKNVGIYL